MSGGLTPNSHGDRLPLLRNGGQSPPPHMSDLGAGPSISPALPGFKLPEPTSVQNTSLLKSPQNALNPLNVSTRLRSPRNLNGSQRPSSSASSTAVRMTAQEVAEQERHEAAVRSAMNAIRDDVVEDDRNLTLWEQAEWNAKVYAIVESGSFPSDIPIRAEHGALVVAAVTTSVILLSCASILALSYPQYQTGDSGIWSGLEVFCVVIFTLDLGLRLLTCPNRKRFMMDFFNWIDIISILPFYVNQFGDTPLPWYIRIIRALRIARVVKVLKSRGIMGLKDLLNTMQESVTGMVLFFIVAGTGTLIFGTMVYFSERGTLDELVLYWFRQCPVRYADECYYGTNSTDPLYNPKHNGYEISPFQSIAGSMWFTIDTMTTTGTGEIEAIAFAGRFVTGVMSFAGVFFIGVPTMVMAGNHVAHKRMSVDIVVRNSWADLLRRKRRLLASVLGSIDVVRRYFAWSAVDDTAWRALDNSPPDPDDVGGLSLAVPAPGRPAAVAAPPAAGRGSLVVGHYRTSFGAVREIRMSMLDPDEFLYEPVMTLARDADGRPKGKVIWASNGQCTVVQFELILDDDDTRRQVLDLVKVLNPKGRIRCDSHSGLVAHHTSPLDTLRTREVGEGGDECIQTVTRWTMLPVRARHGFREKSFPLFFRRNGGSWDDPSSHQDDEQRYEESQLIEDALASLLGSGLLVETFVPIPPIRRRLMIVTQFLQRTRLHRELELCAHRASRYVEFDELTAYITESDFTRLLEGVGRRVELVDPSLVVEDLHLVERQIANMIIRPLRRMRLVQVPMKFSSCVYNVEVLEQDDIVFEVPLSLFAGDEDDEVEQDSVGYVEVNARAAYGRAVRVDFSVLM